MNNQSENACTECRYGPNNTKADEYAFHCPGFGYPELLPIADDDPEVKRHIFCLKYMCFDGASAAAREIVSYKSEDILTIVCNGVEYEVLAFGSNHKPFDIINRYVTTDEPHIVFMDYGGDIGIAQAHTLTSRYVNYAKQILLQGA